jgi:hypothetical protein
VATLALALCAGASCRAPDVEEAVDAGLADVVPAPDVADVVDVPDGPPVRRACTDHFGSGLDTLHGRLDGTLVAICGGDADHVHLQVEMNGATYDVAVNIGAAGSPVYYLARALPLPDGAWAEGWHTAAAGVLDYPSLGVHAGDFAPMSADALAAAIEAELAPANHISVFMTGYGPDGGHEVHRRSTFLDGAIAVRPLSSPARLLLFRFADQDF